MQYFTGALVNHLRRINGNMHFITGGFKYIFFFNVYFRGDDSTLTNIFQWG